MPFMLEVHSAHQCALLDVNTYIVFAFFLDAL